MTTTAPTAEKHPWMDEDLAAVSELARKFFEKEVTPHTERFVQQGYPDRDVYRKAGDLGLLGMSIPEEYSGGGGTFAHEIVLFTEQVRACESSLQLGVHTGVVLHYLLAYAGEDQKRRWLPKLTSGEWVGAIAMTEPGAGSDLQGITTRAVRDGDHYLVSGAKTFISNGHNCDLVIIAAKTDPSKGAAGVSLIVAEVSDETPGFERGRILDKIGQKGQDTTELFFDNLKVPAQHLLGASEGLGFYQLMEQLPQERLIAAAAAVASMELAVEVTTEYTKTRMAFGKPLFALQNTRFELAHCASVAQIGRVFLDDCIAKHLRGELDVATAAMAKYWLTEQQCDVATRCLQLFGGYGYTMEYPIAKIFTDSRIQKIYAGANEVMKELIARSL
ncbi:acyl-CoA dehydrogenase family protein [Hoyosella sp. YIM 151337]|uniref:acyl-CoA dehydrogenase family protein n=1 Tax=Hoyosella sp. YIM 151337 TaxID=2992742 RepID=UPI002235F82C|nr:acyl-CoA dehydrogenase family protein [Hoyosella sp. YIM 151337]MCW4354883.1 acyl-CoA dehydrogenase family protein [Hoyosella sp. YIM 151337]